MGLPIRENILMILEIGKLYKIEREGYLTFYYRDIDQWKEFNKEDNHCFLYLGRKEYTHIFPNEVVLYYQFLSPQGQIVERISIEGTKNFNDSKRLYPYLKEANPS